MRKHSIIACTYKYYCLLLAMSCSEENTYCSCLYYSANALARLMTKLADETFASVNLAPSYAFLLMTVNRAPGIQPTEISKKMMLQPSTVTRLVEKMEFKGYLERRHEGKNTYVHPTQQALDLDADIRKAWQDLLRRYEEQIGKAESQRLTSDIFAAVVKMQD
jgi:DNA-binding MarR family transcriptional regulator